MSVPRESGMSAKAFYLSNSAGGFDVFDATGRLVFTFSTEQDAEQLCNQLSENTGSYNVILGGRLYGRYATAEEAFEVSRQLQLLRDMPEGSTKH